MVEPIHSPKNNTAFGIFCNVLRTSSESHILETGTDTSSIGTKNKRQINHSCIMPPFYSFFTSSSSRTLFSSIPTS